ncbi:type II toxin-antitoxin system VapC family toxin (plasmid) [Komagataeibacter oboediens]|uniref:Ribonuclease VapC n=1 Tax=Komagataeibacter oboediens TaxID=65958 RepID=A0A318QXP1_9PROT|nr:MULTISPECIES: type II toxin-antitoxin system VapC family toxin [Komagataeibacter]PYD80039.1 PIN domain nuclease [Komagataeibacter oboediens]WEQ50639.1 type II toxin-antitoxin system VapC family toxin [Komagataeibacter oboediens]
MSLYLDTSVLVAALTNEEETTRMQDWLGAQAPEDLSISDWVVTEFSSALSIKLRMGQITVTDRANSLAMFTRLRTESFGVMPVTSQNFRTAARFSDQYALGLRAGDALHLAVCADHGATLCTLDRRLAEAGPQVGLATTLL